jgi:hypothetical protein
MHVEELLPLVAELDGFEFHHWKYPKLPVARSTACSTEATSQDLQIEVLVYNNPTDVIINE